MSGAEKSVAQSVARELAECLEDAQRWHVKDDDQLEHRITLALDDYKNATWEPVK
jgi:hypothetical protein